MPVQIRQLPALLSDPLKASPLEVSAAALAFLSRGHQTQVCWTSLRSNPRALGGAKQNMFRKGAMVIESASSTVRAADAAHKDEPARKRRNESLFPIAFTNKEDNPRWLFI